MNTSCSPGLLPVRIAAIQLCAGADVADNLKQAENCILQAVDTGAQLVALPEYFPLISARDTDKLTICEREGEGPLQDFLQQMATRHRIWLIGGTIPLQADQPGKVRNSTLVFNDRGERVARYDKMHLFDFTSAHEQYKESVTIEPGHQVVTFQSPFGPTGLSICYDLRFPELFRTMGEVNLIILPAAFTFTTGKAHWEILLRARAIENQCYVLAPAQGGTHPHGRITWGYTMIIDPWGEVLACRTEAGPGIVTAVLDPDRIAAVRNMLPALRHRTLYGR